MPEETIPPSPETVRTLFRLVGIELTDEQIEAAAADVTAVEGATKRLKETNVGEAEPVFFLPPDGGSR